MKRTIPLFITAFGGFVLIVAFFIPVTETWGETVMIWFDVLASIAFVLGGGSLLKIHLKKISDRQAGWGYSAVTIIAFIGTLVIGLGKLGVPPANDQEHFGETFAPLALADFPDSQVASVPGKLPPKYLKTRHLGPVTYQTNELPASVIRQISQEDDRIEFRGWMSTDQREDLKKFDDTLRWRCNVEKLYEDAQPPDSVKGKVKYYASHEALAFSGPMQTEHRDALLEMSDSPAWRNAVARLYEESRRQTSIQVEHLPEKFEIPEPLQSALRYDEQSRQLVLTGPMSTGQRDQLADQFPIARPLTGDRRRQFRRQLEQKGNELNQDQAKAFEKILDGTWTVALLKSVLDEAGKPVEVDKSACEMLEEMQAGAAVIEPTKTEGEPVELNQQQVEILREFASESETTVESLAERLKQAGPFEERQQQALEKFFANVPSAGERKRTLYFELLRNGPLSKEQRDFLMSDYREQFRWRKKAGELFATAHRTKYRWSGEYGTPGSAFWWIYEYVFKPLTATMFAMLAFYVASAAFRAFRAKNLEAILLLGTAFIILLGRTYAGVLLTAWLPDAVSGLRIENLSVYIMQVFNTAGNRAIMIGIALGIASTSLKVLLGVDRSYLGSAEE